MSRRNQGFINNLIEITAMMPWWAGVVLAVVAYFGLHQFATMDVPTVASGHGTGVRLGTRIQQMLAMVGQYLLPFCFILGSILSAAGRLKRRALHATTAANLGPDALVSMSWKDFEQLVGEAFRQKGFQVKEVGGGGADGGVDLVLHQGSDKYFVQCKQWKATKVGVATVRELFGVMAAQGAVGGYVVTSGQFSKEARDFAAGQNIELIDGVGLQMMIRSVGRPAKPIISPTAKGRPVSRKEPVLKDVAQECPKCGSEMVKRVAKRGANAGAEFWGCTKYPACKGTRDVAG